MEDTPAFDLLPVPEGFVPHDRKLSSWAQRLGPTYVKPNGATGFIVALRVAEQHLNVSNVAHGGMLTTLADNALGMNIALARGVRGAQVTVSLTADFLSSARHGDWLEAHVSITRMGQRLAYANCDLRAGDRHVLRASAVFAFVDRPLPPWLQGDTSQPSSDG